MLTTDGADSYVIRAFPRSSLAVAHELEVLERLYPLGELVPRQVAHGRDDGIPVIVTTALGGHHPDPDLPPETIAVQMADALAKVHRLDGTGLRTEPHTDAAGERVLTHFDFWCGNALWDGDRLVGLVDCSGARLAPRGVDVAWCRQDLVLLGSRDAADLFLRTYEERSGHAVDDIHAWDVRAATQAGPSVESWDVNYCGIGRTELTSAVLRERFDAWTASLRG
ncbi:phosphotransferase family protein [Flexivirga caeni]|uniref:phosphotransferase family protein n=1 Tax=Flexivirga caeni TaxID=2294115 RepID=UPI001FEA0ED1|nr:phosphotransferase [Flexivirga caeni]